MLHAHIVAGSMLSLPTLQVTQECAHALQRLLVADPNQVTPVLDL